MRRATGQATVELALGSVVFVGVLLAGIHLAEYAQLSLKVQEAQGFAAWEAAGRRVQSRRSSGATDLSPFQRTLDTTSGVGPRAERRFADFDGLEGTSGGAVIARALTEGSRVRVSCERDDSLRFDPSPSAAPVLDAAGGLRCEASARIRVINVPTQFFTRGEGGFFGAAVVRESPFRVCGMGLPVGGACRGSLALLTNDWGLANDETEPCKNGCSDSKYRAMVQRLWGGGGGGLGAAFAREFAGEPGTDATRFEFSYSGVEDSMRDFVGGEGDPEFITGGAGSGMVPELDTQAADTSRTRTRRRCFLGKGCPR
jgi:hypothetical protein